jgi:hypothetical protein
MSYHGQTGGSHRSGQKFQKSSHDKKAKSPKAKSGNKKQMLDETPQLSTSEIAEKTLAGLSKLGTQTFALSPFSQYYDDWLVTLRQVVSEFEANPAVAADETFVQARTQIFTDIERELAEERLKEAQVEQSAKFLADTNHLLVEIDADYAHQTHEVAEKRNSDISRLTKKVHELEEELDDVAHMKTSFFGFTKKAKAKKEAEVNQNLSVAKKELEFAVQSFKVEQEKLHDEYEKNKQVSMEKVLSLQKEIATIESDASTKVRETTCNALADAVKAVLQRKTNETQTPAPSDSPDS